MANGGEVEDIEEFPYLGATVDKEDGAVKILRTDCRRLAVDSRD